jgi:2-polyprenyl-3-methyl-5-hydroxy-6-metoxy-1,4-benzoquinol methylase
MDTPDSTPSEKISFIRRKIEKTLPFRDGEFDCITILAVLEHLEYPKEIIAECYRILKPRGRIIVTVPSNYSKPILLALAGLGLISREEVYSHRHYFSKRELEKLLSEVHFIKKSARFYNLFMNLLLVFEK